MLRDAGEQDPKNHRAGNAPEDDLGAHGWMDTRSRQADDDRIVPGERQVDHQDVEKRNGILPPPFRTCEVADLGQQRLRASTSPLRVGQCCQKWCPPPGAAMNNTIFRKQRRRQVRAVARMPR